MAGYFQTPGSHVKFSIDGLQASHEAFRRGTQWSAVIKNAESFIKAGGHAVWKMIEFDHNKSEIAEVRALSEKMGFKKFELRKNNFPGLDGPIAKDVNLKEIPSEVQGAPISIQALENWNEAQIASVKFSTISCRSLDRKNIYLDAHGKVWPCCWVGGLPYRPEHSLRQWMESKVLSRYEKDFNSLHTQSLDKILNHSWLGTDLPSSWNNSGEKSGNPMISTCAKTCGVGTSCQGT
jgi:sulfatase maturation enzyme AslB (radical SAM superfamily)